ncbi:alpha/beta hydrolase [Deinococcus deserti]|uniref:Putative hydrolase or acyltransferase putative alpha/beta hydrolase fold protein n=1 Tax=Deinococcus deserti (strain DSM 17065 / CIP 109153 / LMG 22923 / VCD115) TaxID=546414 RepID=C1CYZ2_DEIDV|nr:alpha/beta hydrolase [Deinococcus deserti]ACO47172.1 putative hydrolase or acyltransferase; putative alpha/beta hydrolase fold protein [Deinococcus deserti VCD115]
MTSLPEYLQIGGQQLEFSWHGPPPSQAPTLVFLHEGLGSVKLWRDFPQALAQATGCGALVYSRAGYGNSSAVPLPRPVTYLHHEAQEVLPQVLAQCEVREFVLVGHSDGGSIALIYAGSVAHPGLLGVITEAAHVFVEDVTVRGVQAAREAYLSGDLRARLARHHAQVDVAFSGWNDTWLSPSFRDWNLEKFLPGIQVPLLVLQGEDDEYGTPKQVQAIVSQVSGPAEGHLLPGCGHTPHREAREAVLHAMTAFMQQLVPGS